MLIFLLYMKLFTIYELFTIKILPAIYQNKRKMPGKTGSAWFIYNKCQVRSIIYTSYLSKTLGRTV